MLITVQKYLNHQHLNCIDPITGAISVAGSVLGGALNLFGLKKKNNQNLQIARETNASNERIAQQANEYNWEMMQWQNQFNKDMWNEQNEYNSPAAQRQRLEDAGLNPLFYGLDGTGNAGALTSAAAQPAATGYAQMPASFDNPLGPLADTLTQTGLTLSEIKLKEAQAENALRTADYQSSLKETEDLLRNGKADLLDGEYHLTLAQTDLTEEQKKQVTASIDNLKAQTDNLRQAIEESGARIFSMGVDNLVKVFRAWTEKQHFDNQDKALAEQVLIQRYNAYTARYAAESAENARANDFLMDSLRYQNETDKLLFDMTMGREDLRFKYIDAANTREFEYRIKQRTNALMMASDFVSGTVGFDLDKLVPNPYSNSSQINGGAPNP